VIHIKSKLVFVANELLDPQKREILNIPMEFITFAFIEGKMYRHFRNQGTFILPNHIDWGNNVVYGAIYAISEFDFYIRLLDSYHQCSYSVLGRNHKRDVHHRTETHATPISFDTFDDFTRLKYRERDEVEVQVYQGNPNHPKITQRLHKSNSYRIQSGVDENIIKLFREERA
jgi:hypothetical protein